MFLVYKVMLSRGITHVRLSMPVKSALAAISLSHYHRGYKQFHSSPNKRTTSLGNVSHQTPMVPASNSTSNSTSNPASNPSTNPSTTALSAPDNTAYLEDFKLSELFSYFCIGVVTLNKPMLNLAIKMFPYMPMWIIKPLVYKIYCGGETMQDLFATGNRLSTRGIQNMMLSLTIEAAEGVTNTIDPNYIISETNKSINEFLIPSTIEKINANVENINSIPPAYVALKPTGFSSNAAEVLMNYNSPSHAKEFDVLVDRISAICGNICDANNELSKKYPQRIAPMVIGVIDAEKHDLQDGVYELQRRLYAKFNQPNKPISVVGTLQMYLSESSQLLALEEKLAKENNYRLGLKLVRGAYIHSERERKSIIHQTKENTDLNYNQGITYCIENILANKGNESTIGHLVVASHNDHSLNLATDILGNSTGLNHNKNNIVLGQLLGMADNITYNLIKNKKVGNVIKYVPWGPPLETKAYLLRRLEENGDAVKNDNGLNLLKAVCSVLFRRMFTTI